MSKNILEINNYSFGYDTRPVLRDISLTINEGDYVSIIGPNGSGKSTLLKSINRIVRHERGNIKLFGRPLSEYTQKEIGRLVGYVPQTHGDNFPYTVEEFILMSRYPYFEALSKPSQEDKSAVDEAINLTHIEDIRSRPIGQLSGGERQKVYLASALAQKPKLLLLDEPTTHLDPKFQMEILQTILEVSSKLNITVLHVTHDLNHIFFFSRHVFALKEGAVLFYGQPDEVLTPEKLKETFGTEFVFLAHPTTNKPMIIPEFKA